MSLQVLRISSGAVLQDGGRPGWRRFGVPPGGAFDREALALGNAMLGNRPDAAGVEMALLGGRFQAIEPADAAIVGASASIRIGDETLQSGLALRLPQGAILEIGPLTSGARAYLCVAGGFGGEPVLGSMSGVPVTTGGLLACRSFVEGDFERRRLAAPLDPRLGEPLRFVQGPQGSEEWSERLESAALTVSLDSNRAGIRLDGMPIADARELTSEPSCTGAIQATPAGQLLVLGPDGPTIGGYPKLGVIVEADLDRLARLRPGDVVRMLRVDGEHALRLADARTSRLDALCAELRAARHQR